MNGKLFYFVSFSTVLNINQIRNIVTSGVKPLPLNREDESFTTDGRLCLTKCGMKPKPGNIGSPTPPTSALKDDLLEEMVEIAEEWEEEEKIDDVIAEA